AVLSAALGAAGITPTSVPAPGAAAPVRRTWWQRLRAWRDRTSPPAGTRPRPRHGPGGLLRLCLLAAVVAGAATALALRGSELVTGVQDHFTRPAAVALSTAQITSIAADPGHPSSFLIDKFSNTWWATSTPNQRTGDLGVQFDRPVDLLDLVITPGAGVGSDEFASTGRPERIDLTLRDTSGDTHHTTIRCADAAGPQTFTVRGRHVSFLMLTVVSAYHPQPSDGQVAIAELELFARRHPSG
ncbi:hypothetical protein, partial [Frankia sp. AgKG'84/4]|uniref:NADase-type glycan-binding domain-containing protein n=1 Tax=Frankia sp. AgKG'84/4 TaxID=573490 RepID=UPI00202A0E1D